MSFRSITFHLSSVWGWAIIAPPGFYRYAQDIISGFIFQSSSFGRDSELMEPARAFLVDQQQIVTIRGTGGIGNPNPDRDALLRIRRPTTVAGANDPPQPLDRATTRGLEHDIREIVRNPRTDCFRVFRARSSLRGPMLSSLRGPDVSMEARRQNNTSNPDSNGCYQRGNRPRIHEWRALPALLQARETALQSPPAAPNHHAVTSLDTARRALERAEETARTRHPRERDYARAHWLLGAAHRVNGVLTPAAGQHFTAAEQHLTEALTRCRSINLVEFEADILLEPARLWAATGKRTAALGLAQEALTITERSEYVLQGADGHLLPAGLLDHENHENGHETHEMGRERREQALAHARAARRLATCDGPPDYTYRVAYEEAGQLLTRLGEPPADG